MYVEEVKLCKKFWRFPIPGVEPGPPGWKPGILTARPYGNSMSHLWIFGTLKLVEGVPAGHGVKGCRCSGL